ELRVCGPSSESISCLLPEMAVGHAKDPTLQSLESSIDIVVGFYFFDFRCEHGALQDGVCFLALFIEGLILIFCVVTGAEGRACKN
ncbi:hypothetical protein BJX62DRAFT_200555, partial [Aspergillus germanicus]